jgi:hypothetical protein
MPRGPKGERRHADVNKNAVLIAKIGRHHAEKGSDLRPRIDR